MQKRIAITVGLFVVAGMFLVASVALAGGPHNKATGSVTWTARTSWPPEQWIPGIVSVFDVHADAPGSTGEYGDRGTFSLYRPADTNYGFPGGSLTVDVQCANVTEDEAWFAGPVTEADGGYSDRVGNIYMYWVSDGGTPGRPNSVQEERIYPLLITEIMPDPFGDDQNSKPFGEWVELYNADANYPVALLGMYLGNGTSSDQIRSLSFIAPHGHILWYCDEAPGIDHMDFKLPASGSDIVLYDDTGAVLDQIQNSRQENT